MGNYLSRGIAWVQIPKQGELTVKGDCPGIPPNREGELVLKGDNEGELTVEGDRTDTTPHQEREFVVEGECAVLSLTTNG